MPLPPQFPVSGDNDHDLAIKIAQNCYEWALAKGVTNNLNPPYVNDTQPVLYRKISYYTAAIADLG